MTIHGGLVSISFRKLTPEAIVALVSQAGLAGIEWGGDVHVPHGNVAVARDVRKLTLDAGLAVAAYGSYYRAGDHDGADGPAFAQVLDSAVALGAPTVRVWAGRKGSAKASDAERAVVLADLRRIATLAAAANISISLEYHVNTLTDTRASVQRLLRELADSAIQFYWQPPAGLAHSECLDGLRDVLPRLTHLHVYHWLAGTDGKGPERRPLAEGVPLWQHYLALADSTGKPRYAMLEFVRDDRPEQFLADATTLKTLLV